MNQKLDQILLDIHQAPSNGMPEAARKALIRATVTLVSMLFTKAAPQLEPPNECSKWINDVILLERLLARWGAEEEIKRISNVRKGTYL